MQNKLKFFVISMCCFIGMANALEIVKYNGDKAVVTVSNNSVNKLEFPSDVIAKAYSAEKSLQVEVNKNAVYVKFIPKIQQETTYNEEGKPLPSGNKKLTYTKISSAELFVDTQNGSYQLILIPTNKEAETVKILDDKINKEEAREFETKDTYVNTLIKLTKASYDLATGEGSDLPSGYKINEIDRTPIQMQDGKLTLTPKYELIGAYYQVTVFEVKNNTAKNLVEEINPKRFTKISIPQKRGIALLDDELAPYQKTWLNIISKREVSK